MKVDKNIAELICTLEYKMGKQTYNPNSYNGWTGEEGCGFKYPVNYCRNKKDLDAHKLTKTKFPIQYIAPECISTMKYAFGSNHLYVGDGIVSILNYLEEIYNIDFNKLEQKRIDERQKTLLKIEERLANGETVRIDSGRKVAGIDIPVGELFVINLKEGYSSYLSFEIYDAEGIRDNYIFTEDDEIEISLEEGYFIESSYPYALRLSGK